MYVLDRRVEMAAMAKMFFNRIGLYTFYVIMIVYLYGVSGIRPSHPYIAIWRAVPPAFARLPSFVTCSWRRPLPA